MNTIEMHNIETHSIDELQFHARYDASVGEENGIVVGVEEATHSHQPDLKEAALNQHQLVFLTQLLEI